MIKKGNALIFSLIIGFIFLIFIYAGLKLAGVLTVADFRSPYNDNMITEESESHRCTALYEKEDVIAVNSRLSVAPHSSLKSINAPIGEEKRDREFMQGASCSMSYQLKSAVFVDRTYFNADEISRCAGTISVTGAKYRASSSDSFSFLEGEDCTGLPNCQIQTRLINNPDCPLNYWISKDWELIVSDGQVVLDEAIDSWVCRDSNIKIPYTAFSDKVLGQDLLIRNMESCVFSDEFNPNIVAGEIILNEKDGIIIEEEDEEEFVDNILEKESFTTWERFLDWLRTIFF